MNSSSSEGNELGALMGETMWYDDRFALVSGERLAPSVVPGDRALPPPDSAPQGRGPDSNLGDSHKTGGGWVGGAGAGHVVVLFRLDHIKAKSARKTLAALAQEVCTTSTDTDAITQLTLLILMLLCI